MTGVPLDGTAGLGVPHNGEEGWRGEGEERRGGLVMSSAPSTLDLAAKTRGSCSSEGSLSHSQAEKPHGGGWDQTDRHDVISLGVLEFPKLQKIKGR